MEKNKTNRKNRKNTKNRENRKNRKIEKITKRRFDRYMDNNDINMEELKKLVANNAILIDVRSPQEYNEGHIENAICIPEYEINSKCNKIISDKNKTIIVYCSSGARSAKAQKRLRKKGYTKVYSLYKGTENYT